jgi:hypothetical protein
MTLDAPLLSVPACRQFRQSFLAVHNVLLLGVTTDATPPFNEAGHSRGGSTGARVYDEITRLGKIPHKPLDLLQ